MALSDILSSIEEQAAQEVAKTEADSRRAAEEILLRAGEEAERLSSQGALACEPQLRAMARGVTNRAEHEAINALRAAREEVVQRAITEAGALLASLRETDRYREVMRALLEEAYAALPEGRLLMVDPRDAGLAETLLRELGVDLRVEPSLETWGGVVISSEEGQLVSNTLEERLAQAEPLLRPLLRPLLTAEANGV